MFVANCVSTDGSGKYVETVEHIAVTAKATSKVVCTLSAARVCNYCVCCDVFGAQIEAKSRESSFHEVSCLFVAFCRLPTYNLWLIKRFRFQTESLYTVFILFLLYILFFRSVNPAMAFETPYRQLHWSHLIFINLWLLLNPWHLCPEYAMGTIPGISSLADPRNLLTLATFAAIVFLGSYSITGSERHRKVVLFSLSLMVFPFLPATNLFFPVGFVVAERVLYLPSMGFCMLVGYGVWHILIKADKFSGFQQLIKVTLLCLLLAHAAKTIQRNREWHSNYTLYHSALRFWPCANNAKMINNLAASYQLNEYYSIAETLYRRAIDVAPDYTNAHMHLGDVLELQLKYSEAEQVMIMIDQSES